MTENFRNIKIKNTEEGIHSLEAFVEDICYEYNIQNTYYGNIQLAMNEAVTNAIIHGNGNDPSKVVDISFFSDAKGLHFIVKDEGEGFDYNVYKEYDVTDLPDNIEEGKKGLLVIKLLADELNFSEQGKTIELVFYISSINYTLTLERKKHLENYFNNLVSLKSPKIE